MKKKNILFVSIFIFLLLPGVFSAAAGIFRGTFVHEEEFAEYPIYIFSMMGDDIYDWAKASSVKQVKFSVNERYFTVNNRKHEVHPFITHLLYVTQKGFNHIGRVNFKDTEDSAAIKKRMCKNKH